MSDKTFRGDLEYFTYLLKEKEPYAITRFGDGELIIIRDRKINLTHKCMGEYAYNPTNKSDRDLRKMLEDSITFESEGYWKGIICPCCKNMKVFCEMSSYAKSNITWANLFVNANYSYVKATYIPELSKYSELLLICNKKGKGKLNKLPFKPAKVFFVGTNAWKNDFHLIDQLKLFLKNKEKWVVLVCAGPFSNLIVHQAWKERPNKNILVNFGSVLDPWLFGRTRGYHRKGSWQSRRVCKWGNCDEVH